MTPIALLLACLSLLIAALGVPMWLEKVPRNRFYGFRTPLTVNQEQMWYPINRIAGKDLALSGAASALLIGLADALPLDPVEPWLLAAFLAPIVLGLLHSFWAASAYVASHLEGEAGAEPKSESAPTSERRPRPQRESER